MKQINTVCTVLRHHSDEVFGRVNKGDLSECTDYIRTLLLTDEAKDVSQEDKDRCLSTLKACEKQPSRYFSTLTTWIIALKC